MPKRSSKKRKPEEEDPNVIAFDVVQQATWKDEGGDGKGDVEMRRDDTPEPQERPEKNPAAVALGRLGGLSGGKARAAKLSPDRRSEIARLAALARWEKAKRGGGRGE